MSSDAYQGSRVDNPETARSLDQELGVQDAPRGILRRHARSRDRVEHDAHAVARDSEDLVVGGGIAHVAVGLKHITVPSRKRGVATRSLD